MTVFAERTSVAQVELGDALTTRFDGQGLIPCVVFETETREFLMLA